MKGIAIAALFLAGVMAAAQSSSDEKAIRKILDDEVTTWNRSAGTRAAAATAGSPGRARTASCASGSPPPTPGKRG